MSLPAPPKAAPNPERLAVQRLLDANLDRAREGLRVLEDWARFGVDRADLVARTKDMRHRLGRLHRDDYKLARHSATDPAAGMAHPAQLERFSPTQVVGANAGRVHEALRVLEEFGRSLDAELAAEAALLRYALYDLEVDLLQASRGGQERREQLARCHLYLVTSPVPQLEAVVEAALRGGVRLVQYRSKEFGPKEFDPKENSFKDSSSKEGATRLGPPLDDSQRLAQARSLRQLCARHGALFIVNDRIDLALAVEADGVHLGQGDLPPAIARQLLGPGKLIGRSTHRLEQLHQAVADGCDYVGVGPVRATPTKPGREPVGLDYVRQAAAESPIPWFAIGGLDGPGVAAVREAGGQRVAVVRAITEAANPEAAATALLLALGQEA